MNKLWDREPAVTTALAGAVLSTLAAFVPSISQPQLAALNALVLAAVGFVTRSQVSPVG